MPLAPSGHRASDDPSSRARGGRPRRAHPRLPLVTLHPSACKSSPRRHLPTGARTLAFHWRRSERNEPAAAFLFSLPGVGFVSAADPEQLGMAALETALAKQVGAVAGESAVSDVARAPGVVASRLGTADGHLVTGGDGGGRAGGDGGGGTGAVGGAAGDGEVVGLDAGSAATAVAAAAEQAVTNAIAAGRQLRLSDLPTAEAMAQVPVTTRTLHPSACKCPPRRHFPTGARDDAHAPCTSSWIARGPKPRRRARFRRRALRDVTPGAWAHRWRALPVHGDRHAMSQTRMPIWTRCKPRGSGGSRGIGLPRALRRRAPL